MRSDPAASYVIGYAGETPASLTRFLSSQGTRFDRCANTYIQIFKYYCHDIIRTRIRSTSAV